MFISIKSNLAPSDLQKCESLTVHLLTKLWGNKYSHTLLIRIKNGTIPVEGNLEISNKTIWAFILWPSNLTYRNLSWYTSNNMKIQMHKVIHLWIQIFVFIILIYYKYYATCKYHKLTSFVITKETTSISNYRKLKKPWYSHIVECYAAVNKNEEYLYELIYSDF